MTVILQIVRDGRKHTVDLTALINRALSENAWDESRHKRDRNGRFSSGPGTDKRNAEPRKTSVANPDGRGKVKRRREIIWLPQKEYARVQHAFMTDVSEEQRKKKVLRKCIGDFLYIGVLRDDEDQVGIRDIIGKEPIE